MRRHDRLARAYAAGIGLSFLAWFTVAEIVEPHWTLALAAMIFPRAAPLEIRATESTTLRLYADPRPHVGKITGLQKGLVWVAQGRELIEEGYGFGCPIVEIGGRSYNSRHAETEVITTGAGARLVKHYSIDTVDTPVRLLRRKYRPVTSQGIVSVTYDLQAPGVIDVTVDLHLQGAWDRVYLMNEQGARVFRYYRDERGTRYEPHEVGIWETGSTERACFESADGQYAFCVQPGQADAVHFGRERYLQYNWRGIYYLSWAGIDLVVDGPRDSYRYRIVLLAR